MKKTIAMILSLFLLLSASALAESIKIDSDHFPDDHFRAIVQEEFDRDGDGTLSNPEQEKATELYASEGGIASVEGIQYLPMLEALDISHNQLASLDLSRNPKLSQVNCAGNKIEDLDISMCPGLLSVIKKHPMYKDDDEGTVSWDTFTFIIDKGTTLMNGAKTIYYPDMFPFVPYNEMDIYFEDWYDPFTYSDVVVEDTPAYSDRCMTQFIGTIPAQTAAMIGTYDVSKDPDKEKVLETRVYETTEASYVQNYFDVPCFITPSALWGKKTIDASWKYTWFDKGTKLYQRPDLNSTSVELEEKKPVAIIAEKDGWLLIRADKKDIDPYFFVPAQ